MSDDARHPSGNEVVLLQEADVLDSPHAELIDLKKLEQDALQRQVALSQLTVSIRDAATLLAAQPSFKAAARLSRLRNQLADLQVGDYDTAEIASQPEGQICSLVQSRSCSCLSCFCFANMCKSRMLKRFSRAECGSTSCLSRRCFANRRQ